MSLSFCHHWSWIQTLKRPPCMIRGHVSFCQGRHPQGWWRFRAPGAHSLCCPRKTECCWNRDSVVPRRHFEGLKRPPRIRLKDSWNWLILFIPATVWQVLKMRCIEWPDTEMMWIYKKKNTPFWRPKMERVINTCFHESMNFLQNWMNTMNIRINK